MTVEVSSAFVRPGTLVRPGPRGRVLRFLVGSLQVSATILTFFYLDVFLHPDLNRSINLGVLIYIVISFLIALRWLGYMVNIAFRVPWGSHLYWVLSGFVSLALVVSLTVFGNVWALPFSILVFLLIIYTTGHNFSR
ncbi:MAG: hypothetical protein HeimC2_10770 [Candidatus Heimdallarchaeota archaeon LC_2]|nr:MAG: hypothetical protein HeimC2_10770 [Candidatus Heimdallarchaeota archaeon LC_2]